MTQFTCQMMPKKEEEQSMDILVLLRSGNKISTEEDKEKKCGSESEGKIMQFIPSSDPSHIQLQSPYTIIDA